jgi:AcrR family transcriptional regulator
MAGTKSATSAKRPAKTRAYSSQRRQAQARQTRTDIVQAAIKAFGANGWSGTTLTAIAAEAGVAVETIYSAFGTKKALLREALDASIAGDTAPIAVADRPEYARLSEGPVRDRIRAGARLQRDTMVRAARVWRAARDASVSDVELAEWFAVQEEARRGQHQDSLARILGRPIDGEQLDLIWVMLSPDAYLRLREARRWSDARYERWISRAVLALAGDLPEFE